MRILTPTDKLIVEEVINKEARKEALDILEKCSDGWYNDFIENYNSNNLNICCLALDFAKNELVKKNIIPTNENDFFGFDV